MMMTLTIIMFNVHTKNNHDDYDNNDDKEDYN